MNGDNNYGVDDLYGTMIRVENKDIFIDLKQNSSGVYLKLSERNGKNRNTVLIPASGIGRLLSVLDEVSQINVKNTRVSTERKNRIAGDPEVVYRSVYTSGLAWSTEEDALIAHFSQAGPVKNAVVLRKNRRGKSSSMGCGVVEFESAADAQNAVNLLNESTLDGRVIKCREDRIIEEDINADSDIQTNQQQQDQPVTTQFQQSATEAQVAVGDVDPNGGGGRPKRVRKPRGNRQQSTPQDDDNASNSAPQQVNAVQSVGTSTSPPVVAAGVDGRDQLDPFKVFVTSLAWETTKEDLAEFFSAIGEVVSTEILMTKKGRSLGHGIVQFADPSSAVDAVERLHKKELHERLITVREYFHR